MDLVFKTYLIKKNITLDKDLEKCMDMEIYNKLTEACIGRISSGGESKKDLFFKNLDFVRNLLGSSESISSQRKKYVEKFGGISLKLYIGYCREYLHNEYEDCLMRNTIRNNMSHLAFYLASSDSGEKKSSVIYNYMLDNGWLNTSTKGSLVVSYEFFTEQLRIISSMVGIDNLVEFDSLDTPSA